MSQFLVYRNPNKQTRSQVPYLLDLQAELLGGLNTRVVAPLLPASRARPARHLNPVFEVEGRAVVLSTAELAGVPLAALGEEVASLREHRDEIIAALDFLFTGV